MSETHPSGRRDDGYQVGLERLRTSRERCCEEDESVAHAIGKKWALESADYRALIRIEKLQQVGSELQQHGMEVDMRQLAEAINGDASWSDATEVSQRLFDCDDPSTETIRGFIDGVLEVLSDL